MKSEDVLRLGEIFREASPLLNALNTFVVSIAARQIWIAHEVRVAYGGRDYRARMDEDAHLRFDSGLLQEKFLEVSYYDNGEDHTETVLFAYLTDPEWESKYRELIEAPLRKRKENNEKQERLVNEAREIKEREEYQRLKAKYEVG
jgi:hypothetical protein